MGIREQIECERDQAIIDYAKERPKQPLQARVEGWRDGLLNVTTCEGRQRRYQQGGRAVWEGRILPPHENDSVFTGRPRILPDPRPVFIAAPKVCPHGWWSLWFFRGRRNDGLEVDAIKNLWIVVGWFNGGYLTRIIHREEHPARNNVCRFGAGPNGTGAVDCAEGRYYTSSNAAFTPLRRGVVALSFDHRHIASDVADSLVSVDTAAAPQPVGIRDLTYAEYQQYDVSSCGLKPRISMPRADAAYDFAEEKLVTVTSPAPGGGTTSFTTTETCPTELEILNGPYQVGWRNIFVPADESVNIDLGDTFTHFINGDEYRFQANAPSSTFFQDFANNTLTVVDEQFGYIAAIEEIDSQIEDLIATRNPDGSIAFAGTSDNPIFTCEGFSSNLTLIDLIHTDPTSLP